MKLNEIKDADGRTEFLVVQIGNYELEESDVERLELALIPTAHVIEEADFPEIVRLMNIEIEKRTRYGVRTENDPRQGFVLMWSNGHARWFLWGKKKRGDVVTLDANYAFVPMKGPFRLKDIERILDLHQGANAREPRVRPLPLFYGSFEHVWEGKAPAFINNICESCASIKLANHYGDCRDLHYYKVPDSKEFCAHSVHGMKVCVFGHIKCMGPAKCLKLYEKHWSHHGGCEHARETQLKPLLEVMNSTCKTQDKLNMIEAEFAKIAPRIDGPFLRGFRAIVNDYDSKNVGDVEAEGALANLFMIPDKLVAAGDEDMPEEEIKPSMARAKANQDLMSSWVIVEITEAFGLKVAGMMLEHGTFEVKAEAMAKLAEIEGRLRLAAEAGPYESYDVKVMRFKELLILQRALAANYADWE